jgi:hypothetical protein
MQSIRTRRRMLAGALTVAAVALAGTAYASASEPDDRTPHKQRTIRLVEKSQVARPTVIDVGEPGLSAGDDVVVRDEVLYEGGEPAGVLRQACTVVDVGSSLLTSTAECVGSLALAQGTLTIAGPFLPVSPEQALAVTGGTGVFRAARGETVIDAEGDRITVRLAR